MFLHGAEYLNTHAEGRGWQEKRRKDTGIKKEGGKEAREEERKNRKKRKPGRGRERKTRAPKGDAGGKSSREANTKEKTTKQGRRKKRANTSDQQTSARQNKCIVFTPRPLRRRVTKLPVRMRNNKA